MAETNALVVRDAEEYYRTMLTHDTKSWNLRCGTHGIRNRTFGQVLTLVLYRDDHFAQTLVEIPRDLGATSADGSNQQHAKIFV